MDEETLLRSLPVDLVSAEDGVIMLRGAMQLHVAGADAGEFVSALLAATAEPGMSRAALLAEFPAEAQAPVARLIDQLTERRVLVPADSPLGQNAGAESPLDIFYWNFGLSAPQALQAADSRTLVVVGTNFLSRRLLTSLVENGHSNLRSVDDPDLRNVRLCDEEGALAAWPEWLGEPVAPQAWRDGLEPGQIAAVVALSDTGNRAALRRWNETCVKLGLAFMPVLLDRMNGEIGPLCIPGQTACYECLRARENANMTDAVRVRRAENVTAQAQLQKTFHGAMAGVVADLAVLDITKLITGAALPRIGHYATIDLIEPTLQTRYVLKVPRCRVCSPMFWRPAPNLDMKAFWNNVISEAQ